MTVEATMMQARLLHAALGCLFVAALGGNVPSFAQTAPDTATAKAAAKLAMGLCSTCHGPEGRGDDPRIPRLAGQQRAYLAAQLKAFRNQSRGDHAAHEYMWGIAATLDDDLIVSLADYFAAQTPAPGAPPVDEVAAKAAAAGKMLFEQGSSERGVLACASCHGADAEGLSVFPRLAGQHSEYLFIQMQAIRTKLRNSPVMHGVIKNLTDREIIAIADYLQSK